MILEGRSLAGCASWFRAYHVGAYADNSPPVLLQRAVERGLPLTTFDLSAHGFYELSTLRSQQVARGKLTQPSAVEGSIAVCGERRSFTAEFDIHFLLHRSGFVVLRPTARFESIQVEGGLTVDALHGFERALWNPSADLAWSWQTGRAPVTFGWGRNFLNYVFLDLFARWQDRQMSEEVLQQRAVETAVGCDEMHRLCEKGKLEHPYPLTFGVEVQVALPTNDQESCADWKARALSAARQILQPLSPSVDVNALDIESDAACSSWYFDENRALTIVQRAEVHEDLGVIDADRTQVVEYLTIRRAALSSVRRASQRVLIEGLPVSRRLVARWRYLVTATTDDYVLDARVGSLFELVRVSFSNNARLRGLDELEGQVRSNLDAFQSQIDTAAEWTGGLIGALVGAAALAVGLQDALVLGVAFALHVPSTEVAEKHALELVTAQISLVGLTFVSSYLLIRRMSDNLKVVAKRRVWRRWAFWQH